MRARQDQRVHGARHAHVAKPALLFKLFGIVERARVREQSLFKSRKKHQRKLQPLGRMQCHQRDARVGIELIGVGRQRRVIEKLGQRLAAHLGIVRGVGQFLQVLNAAEGLRRAFGFERLDVAGAVDEEADQLRQRSRIARLPETASGFSVRISAGAFAARTRVCGRILVSAVAASAS